MTAPSPRPLPDLHEGVFALLDRLLSAEDRDGAALVTTMALLTDPVWPRALELVDELATLGEPNLADEALDVLERLLYRQGNVEGLAAARVARAQLRVRFGAASEAIRAIEGALAVEAVDRADRVRLQLLLLEVLAGDGDDASASAAAYRLSDEAVGHPRAPELLARVVEQHQLALEADEVDDIITTQADPAASFGGDPIPVYVLEDVDVVLRDGGVFVFDASGDLVEPCSTRAIPTALRAAREQARGDRPAFAGTSWLLRGNDRDRRFDEWLLDWLTLLPVYASTGLDAAHVLVDRLDGPVERQSLEVAGIDAEQLVEVGDPGAVHVDRLVTVAGGITHGAHPELLAWWRRVATKVARRRATPARRLFVSSERKTSLRRQVRVAGMLERHGFTVLDPLRLPFDEQVSLFASASVVVGATHPGLANVVFAPSQCRVFEVKEPDDPGIEPVASALGLDYASAAPGDSAQLQPWLNALPRLKRDTRRRNPLDRLRVAILIPGQLRDWERGAASFDRLFPAEADRFLLINADTSTGHEAWLATDRSDIRRAIDFFRPTAVSIVSNPPEALTQETNATMVDTMPVIAENDDAMQYERLLDLYESLPAGTGLDELFRNTPRAEDDGGLEIFNAPFPAQQLLWQYYNLWLCNELRRDHERRTGQKYDVVVRTRFDSVYGGRMPKLEGEGPWVLNDSTYGRYPHIDDKFYIARPEMMDRITAFHSNIRRLIQTVNKSVPIPTAGNIEFLFACWFLENRFRLTGLNERGLTYILSRQVEV